MRFCMHALPFLNPFACSIQDNNWKSRSKNSTNNNELITTFVQNQYSLYINNYHQQGIKSINHWIIFIGSFTRLTAKFAIPAQHIQQGHKQVNNDLHMIRRRHCILIAEVAMIMIDEHVCLHITILSSSLFR